MANLQQLREAAEQLRQLQRDSPTQASDVPAWEAAARKFSESLSISLPPQVMHYLHDADIRLKEPAYRTAQDEILSKIISDLEAGTLSAPSALSITFHPRWLGVVALVAAAVIYWAWFGRAA